MYPAIYRAFFLLILAYRVWFFCWFFCLQHSLFFLCKRFCRKLSSKLPYNRWAIFYEHILTPIFSQKLFQFSLLSGSRLFCRNKKNIFFLSTHFVPVKLTNSKNWSVKSCLYSWSCLYSCPKILLRVHAPVQDIVLNFAVCILNEGLLSRKLFSLIAPVREHKSWLRGTWSKSKGIFCLLNNFPWDTQCITTRHHNFATKTL